MLYFIFFYFILFCTFVLILPGQMQNVETKSSIRRVITGSMDNDSIQSDLSFDSVIEHLWASNLKVLFTFFCKYM
jgi:hypothetical protein